MQGNEDELGMMRQEQEQEEKGVLKSVKFENL